MYTLFRVTGSVKASRYCIAHSNTSRIAGHGAYSPHSNTKSWVAYEGRVSQQELAFLDN